MGSVRTHVLRLCRGLASVTLVLKIFGLLGPDSVGLVVILTVVMYDSNLA